MRHLFSTIAMVFSILVLLSSCKEKSKEEAITPEKTKPNVIIFYVDDLGFGDVSSYGATNVNTPNIDALAQSGIKFTDGHSTTATCSPSRYSLLTGSYAFRNNAQILKGDAPLMIHPDQYTLPDAMKDAGYYTSIVGKWHLGLGEGNLDWNGKISPGPLELGFDHCFLIPATGDRVPTVYVENHHVVGLDPVDTIRVDYTKPIGDEPTGLSNPELLRVAADAQHSNAIVNGVSRIGYMTGGESALWVDEDFADILTNKAIEVIDKNPSQPFFLMYSFHDIHVPRLPHKRFIGATDMGPRGDAIVQTDWCVGEIVSALKERGLYENTLIIFTSDNGPVLFDGYFDDAVELVGNHKATGPYNGGKYSAYEGGTRVPTIVSWPKEITPKVSDALVSQVDLLRTLSVIAGFDASSKAGPDSQDQSEAWLGKSDKGRTFLIEESQSLALRMDNWKYIKPAPGTRKFVPTKDILTGNSELEQLYDLANDINETNNLADEKPEILAKMKAKLEEIINAE